MRKFIPFLTIICILMLLVACGLAPTEETPPASNTSAEAVKDLQIAMDSAWESYLASLVPELAGTGFEVYETRSGSFTKAAANETFLLLSAENGKTVGLVIDSETFAFVEKITIDADPVNLYLFRTSGGRDYPLIQWESNGRCCVSLYSVSEKGWDEKKISDKLSGLLADENRSVSCVIEDGELIHVFDGDKNSESLGERCQYLYSLQWAPDSSAFEQFAISPHEAYIYDPDSSIIPDEVIIALTTPALAETIFNQPNTSRLHLMSASPEENYLRWRETMVGLEALEARPDGFNALYWYYKLNFERMDAYKWAPIESLLLYGEFTSEESIQAQSQLDPTELVSLSNSNRSQSLTPGHPQE